MMSELRRLVLPLMTVTALSCFGCQATGSAPSATEGGPPPTVASPSLHYEPGGPDDLFDEAAPAAPPAPPQPATCPHGDSVRSKAEWDRFRQQRPFHTQAIALSAPFASGCRALIVAEPPPGTSTQSLVEIAPAVLMAHEEVTQKIGHDGWVRDIVFTIPTLNDGARAEVLGWMHLSLFGTTYGAHVVDLAKPALRRGMSFDLKVSPAELVQWLLDEEPTVAPVDGGREVKVAHLLRGQRGVYVAKDANLVLWSLPRKRTPLSKAAAREFAAASDLVLGALGSPDALVIAARRRQVSFEELPPLRFETVSLLASTRTAELAQSYERTNIFAGRFEPTREWAPILLSPELVDTEYGSLLNITDQILKSWSNAGQTQYFRFSYPPPRGWPIRKAVPDQVETAELTYNWNTRAAGAAVTVGESDNEVFWLRRTGALNVTYLPREDTSGQLLQIVDPHTTKARAIARTAYDAFAESRDSHLARVVQYNALYQIFRHFLPNDQTADTEADDPSTAIGRRLGEFASKLIGDLADAPPALLRRAVTKAVDGTVTDMFRRDVATSSADVRRILALFPSIGQRALREMRGQLRADLLPKYLKELESLQADVRTLSAEQRSVLAKALASGRRVAPASVGSGIVPVGGVDVAKVQERLLEQRSAVQGLVDLAEAKRRYESQTSPAPGAWIHTPSLVVSWNMGSITGAEGGHNLDSTLATLNKDSKLANVRETAGKINVDRKALGTLRLDADGISAGPHEPPRQAHGALGIGDPAAVPAGTAARPSFGWRPRDVNLRTTQSSRDIRVSRQPGGYVVDFGDQKGAFEATTLPDVVDLVDRHRVTDDKSVLLHLDGFAPDEARGFVRSVEIRGRAKVAGLLGENAELAGSRLDFSKARVFEPRVREVTVGVHEIGVAAEIPVLGKASVWLRVKVLAGNLAPEALTRLLERVKAKVLEVLQRAMGKPEAAQDVAVALRTELRDLLDADGHIEIRVRQEATDIVIVQTTIHTNDARDRRIPA